MRPSRRKRRSKLKESHPHAGNQHTTLQHSHLASGSKKQEETFDLIQQMSREKEDPEEAHRGAPHLCEESRPPSYLMLMTEPAERPTLSDRCSNSRTPSFRLRGLHTFRRTHKHTHAQTKAQINTQAQAFLRFLSSFPTHPFRPSFIPFASSAMLTLLPCVLSCILQHQ